MIKAKLFGFLSLVFALAFGQGTLAQVSSNKVGAHGDWFVFEYGKPKECWGTSPPLITKATKDGKKIDVRRGDIGLYVRFVEGGNTKGDVSFVSGYSIDSEAPIEIEIDKTSFSLVKYKEFEEWVWVKEEEYDQVLNELKKGKMAVVTATSARTGTKTVDIFSLKGFTDAMLDAEVRCK